MQHHSQIFALVAFMLGLTACGTPRDISRSQADYDSGYERPQDDDTTDIDPADGDNETIEDHDVVGDLDGDNDVTDTDGPDQDILPNEPDDFEVTACTGLPPAPTTPGCSVTPGDARMALIGAVLTPSRVYDPGVVLIEGTQITCTGCGCDFAGATVVNCGSAVISPGLINAHDHIGWINTFPYTPGTVRYEHRHDWRKGDAADHEPKIPAPMTSSNASKQWGELRFVLGGATSTNASGSSAGLLRNLDIASGLEGLGAGAVKYDTFPLGDSDSGVRLTNSCNYPNIVEPSTVANASAYTPHVGEGNDRAARNEFLCMIDTAAGGKAVLTQNAAIIHGIGMSRDDIARVKDTGMKLIWSPRTNITLYGDTAPVTLYHRLGVPIALGTDWLPTGSMNMLRELSCAAQFNTHNLGGYFSSQDLWRMATLDAARALNVSTVIGKLAANMTADIAVFKRHGRSPYAAVVYAEAKDVQLVLRGGKVLSGADATVSALAQDCDAVSVCGDTKRVCVKNDIGKTLAQMISDVGNNRYQLASCGAPADEPSCVPYRNSQDVYNNSSVYENGPTALDQDGDGIADAEDNCPSLFNPIRPLDLGVQKDSDGDGVGDLCDVCPFDAALTDCATSDVRDLDQDTVVNDFDNCPSVHNTAQIDTDGDGMGDACDACPNYNNAGGLACPVSIYAIKQGTFVVGTRVAVQDLVVTAVGALGFAAQLSPSSTTFDTGLGAQFSGVFIYATSDQPAVGQGINITSATIDRYNNQWELANIQWSAQDGLAPIAPTVVAAANITSDGAGGTLGGNSPYEGVLVTVQDLVVVNAAPTAGTGDNAANEFLVNDNLRVDDFWGYAITPAPANNQGFSSITGVALWRNLLMKLVPRSIADVTLAPPGLSGFSQELVYQRAGITGPAIPESLLLHLTGPATQDMTISITSSDPTVVSVANNAVVVPAGSSSVEIELVGGADSDTPVELTAAYEDTEVHTLVRVLADNAQATLVSLTPTDITMFAETQRVLTVSLDLPAPAGGFSITLSVEPALGVIPAQVVIPADAQAATFTFVAGLAEGEGVIEATDGDVVLLANVTVEPGLLDIGGYRVLDNNSPARSITFPTETAIAPGTYVVIGRNASQLAFEAFWGTTLGDNVRYINGITLRATEGFPILNGNQNFTLRDATTTIEGPTRDMQTVEHCFSRNLPRLPASESDSWTQLDTEAGSNGTPGSGMEAAGNTGGLFISEVCDGQGGHIYEFIELYYPGP